MIIKDMYYSAQLGDVDWKITAFTTRPETIFGVTFLALSSDHELVVYLKVKLFTIQK